MIMSDEMSTLMHQSTLAGMFEPRVYCFLQHQSTLDHICYNWLSCTMREYLICEHTFCESTSEASTEGVRVF